MPEVCREDDDKHIGHASSTPNPKHQTQYKSGLNTRVYVEGKLGIVVGDKTACGDVALEGSARVFFNGIPVHRKGDATGGHGTWVENAAATGSSRVIAGG